MKSATKRDNAKKVKIFRRFFTGLGYVYGTYDPVSGRVRQEKRPVDDKVILEHLSGRKPYGVYLLVKDKTRAIAVDFDKDNIDLPVKFLERANHYGIHAYIERSKTKGHHVWIFFDEQGVPAAKARLVVRHILEEIEEPETEIFPKHDSLDTNVSYGNFINAPLFGRLVQKSRTVFIETKTLKPYPNQWDFLENVIQYVPENLLDEIIKINGLNHAHTFTAQKPQPKSDHNGFFGFGLPPCARRILKEGVTDNQRVACFRLAVHLKRIGLPYDTAVAALKVWALRNRPDNGKRTIIEQEIMEQVSSAFNKDYRGYGCEDSAIAPFCDPECPLYQKKQGNAA